MYVPGRRRLFLLAVVGSLTLSACGTSKQAIDPKAQDLSADAMVVSVPPVLEQSAAKGVTSVLDSSNDAADQRSIAIASVPGSPRVDAELKSVSQTKVTGFNGEVNPGIVNELNITWDPVLASGPILGVRVMTRSYTGGTKSVSTSTSMYADLTSDQAWQAAQLVAEPHALARLVAHAVQDAKYGDKTPSVQEVTQDLRFGSDGSITVVLPAGAAADPTFGTLAVEISSEATPPLLTPQGLLVRSAAMSLAPFAGAPAAPQPAPGPSAPSSSTAPQPDTSSVDCAVAKCIALTFDDGPGPYTSTLLDELAAKNVHATFFLVGKSVAARPELVQREVSEGNAVGNHSWDHPNLSKIGAQRIAGEVNQTAAAIQSAAGVSTDLMRPPYGATNSTVASTLAGLGDAQILWNVDTEDWKNRNAQITTQRALDGAAPGAIILMHDIHPTTVEALPGIIDQLRARGYTLVTVPQLLGPVQPGKVYSHR